MKRRISYSVVKEREPMTSPDIYKLLLHEVMPIETDISDELWTSVMRVPGGWIYRSYDKGNKIMSTSFVPYDNEWLK